MRLQGLDLNLLVVLNVLLEEQNVSRAAERLGLGQSTVSAALSRLREHFDDGLLVKGSAQMLPTALSQELRPKVREWLSKVEGLLGNELVADSANLSGIVRVACTDVVAATLIPEIITWLAGAAPSLGVQLVASPKLSESELETWLNRNQIDCLIADFATMQRRFLCVVPWACVARSDHPFWSQSSKVLDAFERWPHARAVGQIVPGDEGRLVQVRVPGYLAIGSCLAMSDCLACLPVTLLDQAMLGDTLKARALPTLEPMSMFVSWSSSKEKDSRTRWLCEGITSAVMGAAGISELQCAISR